MSKANRSDTNIATTLFDWIDLILIVFGAIVLGIIFYLIVMLTGYRQASSEFGRNNAEWILPLLFFGPIVRRSRARKKGVPLSTAPPGVGFLSLIGLIIMIGSIPFLLIAVYGSIMNLVDNTPEFFGATLRMFCFAAIAFCAGALLDRCSVATRSHDLE